MTQSEDDERQRQSLENLVETMKMDLHRLMIDTESNASLFVSIFNHYEIYNELFLTITSGPNVNLVDYLIDLDRLNNTLEYFKSIEVSDEQKRVVDLYNVGRQKLIEESDAIIMQSTNPIPPEELLELCKSMSLKSNDTDDIFVSELRIFRIIFHWFQEHGFQQGLIDLYATKRGNMIYTSLKMLTEHLQQKSVRRASINTLTVTSCSHSRRSSFSSDTFREQVKTKFTEITSRITHSPVFGGRNSSVKTTSLLSPKMGDHLDIPDVDNSSSAVRFSDDRETNNYKFLLDAFVILLLRDLDLLFYVFSNEFKSLILIKLMEKPLTYMYDEVQQLCTAIMQLPCKINSERMAFYGLFSILQWFSKSESILTKLYEEGDLMPQYQFSSTLSNIVKHSIMEYLKLVLDEVRSDSSALSQGGHVHSLTINMLDFMESLLDYENIINSIQSNCIENQQITNNAVSQCPFNLNKYFGDLIRVLRFNILKKIEMFIPPEDNIRRAIFLLNNINYLLQRLENSLLLTMIEPNLISELEHGMQKCRRIYMKCYMPMMLTMQTMFDYDDLNHLSNDQLRECDRSQLKGNFLKLNATIDTLRQQHQALIVDDVQLRNLLQIKSKKLVLNIFTTYYSKFAHKHFTHHPEKYIRYNPSVLENIIDTFFE